MKSKADQRIDCCHNTWLISGETESLQQLMKCILPNNYLELNESPKKIDLDFNNILAIPTVAKGQKSHCSQVIFANGNHRPNLTEHDKWRIRNWGTRFNPQYAIATRVSNTLIIYFTTHWSPPNGVFQFLVKEYQCMKLMNWSQNLVDVGLTN